MKYTPHTQEDIRSMLVSIGAYTVDDLFSDIPPEMRVKGNLNIPEGLSEMAVAKRMEDIAGKNKVFPSVFRGAGAYKHFIPAVVNHLASRSEFYTAYTPYQPEISQGILQAIFEYQSMICALTDMDASNASVYDGATAASEAVSMCLDRKRRKAVVAGSVNPQIMGTLKTWCNIAGVELAVVDTAGGCADLEKLAEALDDTTACVVVQQPNFFGLLEDIPEIEKLTHGKGAKLVMSVNPISLGLLKTPGQLGADIAVGEGQPLGNALNFGGPYLGFMACREAMMRKLPGRIVGETVDHDGNRGFVLTLQAREQHIRREKASSNICSNQALNALIAAIYMATMGREGMADVARQCAEKARYAAKRIAELQGYEIAFSGPWFHEFVVRSSVAPEKIEQALAEKGILSGLPLGGLFLELKDCMLWCCTEANTAAEIDAMAEALREVR